MADNPVKFSELFQLTPEDAALLDSLGKAVTTLKGNYKKFADVLEKDGQRVAQGLAALRAQAGDIRTQAQQVNLLAEQERATLASLQSQIAAVLKEQQRLKDVQEAQAKAQLVVNDATKQAQSAYRALQNELREAYATKDTARIERAALAIRQARTETATLSAALRGTNTELTAARGSYDALDAENKRLIASLKALGQGLGDNNAQAQALQKQIADNTQKLKEFDEKILVFSRNVGNYKGSFSELVTELAKARAAQQGMAEGTAAYAQQQTKVIGFQTAAQKSAAQMGLSYEQANAKIEAHAAVLAPLATNLVRLEKEQQEVARTAGQESEAYRKLGFQIQQTKQQLDAMPASTEKAGAGFKGVAEQLGFTKDGLASHLTQLGVGLLGVQALFSGVGAAFATDSEFQTALSSLSALTGATGEDLQFMADKAAELGPKVGKSATDVLKAFELIGSAQPALLDSKENLAAVTEQALLLAAAAGEELPAAAEALTGVMNQFQAPAEQAARYVNALAAGAKEGAATIPQSAAALKYFGVNAATANVSVEKSVALIQVLAERSIKGEQAGVQLRNILARLAAGAKETNPEVVGLSTALDNLGKRNLSTAQYVKLFGVENANTAKILVESRQKVEDLTQAVTGTQTANEQAAKQLDNIATAGSRFGAVIKNIVISSLDGLNRSLGSTLNQLSNWLSKLTGNTKSVQENTAATVANGLANQQVAATAQALLERYQQLTAQGLKPAKDGKGELNLITLQLRDSLGESATAIDKETGQLVLNEAATKRLISQKLLLSNQAVSTLVLEADALKEQMRQEELRGKALAQQISTREKLLGLTAAQARAQADDFANNMGYGELSAGVEQLSQATIALGGSRTKLTQLTADYNTKLDGLAKLNARAAYETGLLNGATSQQAQEQQKLSAASTSTTEILDRNLKALAEQRRADLTNQLSDTQKRLEDLKKLQTEQGKLFDDKQLSPEVFRASVAATQEQITALERQASATRIKILRAERDEKLYTIHDEAIRSKRAKGLSAAEIADIEAAAATKRLTVVRQFSHDVLKEQQALQDKLEVKPLEFRVAVVDLEKFKRDLNIRTVTYEEELEKIKNAEAAANSELVGQLARREITEGDYDTRRRANRKKANEDILALDKKFHKANLYDQRQANDDALDDAQEAARKRLKLAQYVEEQIGNAGSYYFQFRQQQLDVETANQEAAKEKELAVAGDNAALKEQISQKYAKLEAERKVKQAKIDRDTALFQIALNTAMAVTSVLSTGGGTRYADFGISAGVLTAIVIANGLAQAALVLAKPLPQYFKGRKGGPAETALVAEQGPELIGQPSTGYRLVAEQAVTRLQAGDRVYTAPETKAILAQNELVEGRLLHRAQQASLEQQTRQLRTASQQAREAEVRAMQHANGQLLQKLGQIERTIKEQEYYRLNEQDDLVRRSHRANGWRDEINKRYRRGRN